MSTKKLITLGVIAGSLISIQSVYAAEMVVKPSKNALTIKSADTTEKIDVLPAYLYQDNNYFMLRDIGKLIGYQIKWDSTTKNISMSKDKSAQNFVDLSVVKQAQNIKKSYQTIIIEGNKYKNLDCLNIDGYNYFKLRDLAGIMDFTCGWDSNSNTIMLTLAENNNPKFPIANTSVEKFLDPDLKQQVIKEDVTYISGSKDYNAIEKYMQKTIDESFKAEDFIIVEDNFNGLLSNVIVLDMRLDVNGIRTKNFGYRVTCIEGKAALITFIGEKNPEFDMTKVREQQLSDEDAKKKALETDGFDYEVEEQRIYRYFDMDKLVYQCEVETVYIKENGTAFATSHIF